MKEIFYSKCCHGLWDSFGKHDKGIGYSQVLNYDICGLEPKPSDTQGHIMMKKREIC